MDAIYESHGVKFCYPPEWELTEEDAGEQISITVSSPASAFWTLNLFPGCPEPDDVVAAVMDAFYEEYDELDEYPAQVRLCKRATVARDIDFVCLELLNSACVRSFRAREFTVLVLFQLTEGERAAIGPIFERMTRSLACPAVAGD